MGNAQQQGKPYSQEAAVLEEARRTATFDEEERSALLFLTSKNQELKNIPKNIEILTNCGSRSGVQLSARPGLVYLSTRNFCSRLLKNQNPICLRFLLDGLVSQLSVVSGETPSLHSTGDQRAIYIQRTCNTLVVVRTLLTELIIHHHYCSSDNGTNNTSGSNNTDNNKTTPLLEKMLPSKDREQLLLGLLQFCNNYLSKPVPSSSFTSSDGTFSAQQMDYDVHLNVINLLLVLMSTRLFSYHDSSLESHPFHSTLLSIVERKPYFATTIIHTLLRYYIHRENAPSTSSYRDAMRELRNGPGPRYASMTSPPMPSGYEINDKVASHSFQPTMDDDYNVSMSYIVSGIYNGLYDGISTSINTFAEAATVAVNPILGVSSSGQTDAASGRRIFSQCPLADRAMLLLSVLVHDKENIEKECKDEANGNETKSNNNKDDDNRAWNALVFRRALSNIQDLDEEEDRRVFSRGSNQSKNVDNIENGTPHEQYAYLSFSSLYESIIESFNASFLIMDVRGSEDALESGDEALQSEIFRKLRQRTIYLNSAILLYTLITTSTSFKEYVLSRTDLENIILPLLRSLHEHHRNSPMPFSHLYVVHILLLMFSQDSSYASNAFTIMDRLDNSSLGWFHGDSSGGGDGGGGSSVSSVKDYKNKSMRWSLGDVQLVVLMRCMQAEATRTRWKSTKGGSGGGDGDSGVCKSSDRSYLRDNLSAIVSNLTPHCVHIHSSVADRMIHLLKVLTRRIRWAGRRAKEISGNEIVEKTEIDRIAEECPMLGCIVKYSAGSLRPDAVFSEWQQSDGGIASLHPSPPPTTTTNQDAVDELKHLETQVAVTATFLKNILDALNACLGTKSLQHNVKVLYALLHSAMTSSPNSDSGDHLLTPFKDKTIIIEYEYNTKLDQETSGMWALDLCRSSDPLTDIISFMRSFLDEKQKGMGGCGWVDVESVMDVLEDGIRNYKTQRAAQLSQIASQDGSDSGENEMETPTFVYEELDGASDFFLPYSWSLVLDVTRELGWDTSSIELFPMMPYFKVDSLMLEEGGEETETETGEDEDEDEEEEEETEDAKGVVNYHNGRKENTIEVVLSSSNANDVDVLHAPL